MKKDEGKEILNDLAKNSDIFIQNFPPLTAQKLKIDYENISTINPSLIYASVTGFPQYSDWANKQAFDLTI